MHEVATAVIVSNRCNMLWASNMLKARNMLWTSNMLWARNMLWASNILWAITICMKLQWLSWLETLQHIFWVIAEHIHCVYMQGIHDTCKQIYKYKI